jgi:hypothetical protein
MILRGTDFMLKRTARGYVIRDMRSGVIVARPSTIADVAAWIEPPRPS